jgi:O-antigen/teichoic acid export membrane protein
MGLFGSQFTGGALVLMVVAAGELVNVTTGGVGMMLYMTGGQRIVAITNVAAAIVVSGALFLVCPVYGVIGAAVCMGAGRGGVNLVRLWWLWRRRDIHPYNARFGICTAVTVALVVIAMLVGNAGGLQALGAVIGFYVCFGIVVWYGWLGAEGFALRNLRPADSDGSVEEDR